MKNIAQHQIVSYITNMCEIVMITVFNGNVLCMFDLHPVSKRILQGDLFVLSKRTYTLKILKRKVRI